VITLPQERFWKKTAVNAMVSALLGTTVKSVKTVVSVSMSSKDLRYLVKVTMLVVHRYQLSRRELLVNIEIHYIAVVRRKAAVSGNKSTDYVHYVYTFYVGYKRNVKEYVMTK
jgi:hypothetical protein